MVQEAARAGHHEVHAGAQLLDLGGVTHPAVDAGVAQTGVAAQVAGRIQDLLGQLAGGRDDQAAGLGALARLGLEPVQNGQEKGRGLARAGLGQAHDVTAFFHRGDGLFLDRGGGHVAEGPDIGQKTRIQLKVFEIQNDSLGCGEPRAQGCRRLVIGRIRRRKLPTVSGLHNRDRGRVRQGQAGDGCAGFAAETAPRRQACRVRDVPEPVILISSIQDCQVPGSVAASFLFRHAAATMAVRNRARPRP